MAYVKKLKPIIPFLLFFLLAFTYTFILAKPINLAVTDIGRHLVNGREVIAQNWQILYKNTYSFSMPNQPFVNHHWFSGVVFWLVYSIGGFHSLHLFHTGILLAFFGLFFVLLKKHSSWLMSFLLCLFSLIFLAGRTEIRPESFGFLLLAIVLLIIQKIRSEKQLSWKTSTILIITQLIWVNLHISFVFGMFTFALFTLIEKTITKTLNKNNQNKLIVTTILMGLVNLINPNTIQGALTPFMIFQDYGYRVYENQNLWFLRNMYQGPVIPLVFIISLIIFLIILFMEFPRNYIFEKAMAITGVFLGLNALRNTPLFVIFTFPLLAQAMYQLVKIIRKKITFEQPKLTSFLAITIPFLIIWISLGSTDVFRKTNKGFVFGLIPNQQEALNFLNKLPNNAKVFNNYDVGSLLVFSFYPDKKVFVDNRPEAFSSDFFQNLYIPMQNSDTIWQQALAKYDFNFIVFGHIDLTPWAQAFMKARLRDQAWKIIYIDETIIVFAKDIPDNQDLIKQFMVEVPLSRLRI